MSENAELTEDGIQNIMPDPDKKIEQRFAEYCQRIKNEILDSSMYAKAQKEAESAIGLDRITVQKKVSFLKAKSRFFLRENNNNPVLALDRMTDYLESELKASDRNYNYVAIRYYLISEIPKCNIFPNE